jgi:hypothetical protein
MIIYGEAWDNTSVEQTNRNLSGKMETWTLSRRKWISRNPG